MHFKNTIEAISISLDEVHRQILAMGDEGNISSIDLDLAADKMRHIYDLLLSLRIEYPNFQRAAGRDDSSPHPTPIPEPAKEIVQEIVSQPEEVFHEPVKHSTPETVRQPEPEKAIIPEPVKQTVKIEDIKTAKPGEEKRFVGDSFAQGKQTLAEELAGHQPQGNLTDKLKAKPISSISGAIGLNEKFELMQNLFKGNKEKYDNTLHVLNMASDYNEASDYLANTLQFDMENEYVQRLLELVRRKLIAH